MNEALVPLTRKTLQRLRDQMKFLSKTSRDLAAEASHAYETGGYWHDNFAYDETQREQGRVAAQLATVRYALKNHAIIDDMQIDIERVGVGTAVTLRMGQDEFDLTILGPFEIDLDADIVSHEAPLVEAVTGKKVGEKGIFQGMNVEVVRITAWKERLGEEVESSGKPNRYGGDMVSDRQSDPQTV